MNRLDNNRVRRWLLVLGLTLPAMLGAGEQPAAVLTPGPAPERIILGIVDDPRVTMAVSWRTERPVALAVAQRAPWSGDPGFEDGAQAVGATSTRLDLPGGRTVWQHEARFCGLSPDTSYAYRVGGGEVWSEWSRMRTASAIVKPFRFVFLGDIQDEIKSKWSRVVRAAYAHAPDASFLLMSGDLISNGWDDSRWGEWCYAMGFIPTMLPVLATPGNHDIRNPPPAPKDSPVVMVHPLWRAHLSLPLNGPAEQDGLREEAWVLDYQGARIVSVEGNVWAEEDFSPEQRKTLAPAQLAWLDQVLGDAGGRFKIVLVHEPLYSVAKTVDFADLREALRPILDRHKVDLVLSGHNHRYARSHKLAGDRVVAPDAAGTVYVTATSGPKIHVAKETYRPLMAVFSGEVQTFEVVTVDSSVLGYESYLVTGELQDAFELVRDASGGSSSSTSNRPASRPGPEDGVIGV